MILNKSNENSLDVCGHLVTAGRQRQINIYTILNFKELFNFIYRISNLIVKYKL